MTIPEVANMCCFRHCFESRVKILGGSTRNLTSETSSSDVLPGSHQRALELTEAIRSRDKEMGQHRTKGTTRPRDHRTTGQPKRKARTERRARSAAPTWTGAREFLCSPSIQRPTSRPGLDCESEKMCFARTRHMGLHGVI